ncbi:MAG: hypothetical protein PF904_21345 [Kiritimatiellae bacterium]|jgi:hypothetical protein|nr:hypothetical protein [Kiritimatiellia bacterium]
MKLPPKPSKAIVNDSLETWTTLENDTLQEKSLSLLFNELCPGNTRIENVLLKVSALNDFYSTNIYDTYTVAKHILSCNIDSDLENGDFGLVNKIALVEISGKKKNFYSFASKYCSHHKHEIYPIYDSYVVKMLMYFKKKDKFCYFKKDDLKTYEAFLGVIRVFQKFYGLKDFSLRQIDIYLWLAGKEFFPNKY